MIPFQPFRNFISVALKPDGSGKIPSSTPRLTLRPAKGGAIRLSPWTDGPLAIAEGVETALDTGMWSLVLHGEARAVVICADNDSNSAGQTVAQFAAERWRAEGLSVEIAFPDEGGYDWNDVLSDHRKFEEGWPMYRGRRPGPGMSPGS